MSNSGILVNLVFALAVAAIGASAALRLRQPIILGYILAGVMIGPYTPGFVGDSVAVEALADVGVILLMFAIGVQLSVRDLLRVGGLAIGGGLAQVGASIGLGYLSAVLTGWPPLAALFLGAVCSISGSTVLIRVLEESGTVDSPHGRVVLAWSSVQDFCTIVLVVILTSLASGHGNLGADLAWSVAKAAIFLAIVIPVGLRGLPWLLSRVAFLDSRELFIIAVAALALGAAYASSLFGMSLALGAFVAGVVVSESDLSHQVLGEVGPIRDVFGGIFFVSVGMLVDPGFVLSQPGSVLAVAALIILVKGALVTAIARLAGQRRDTAILVGALLAQSAEFSFILARLGAGLGVLSHDAFTVLLSGAVVSIVVAPYLFRLATRLAARVGDVDVAGNEAGQVATAAGSDATSPGHAIICGYGRVGRVIGDSLRSRDLPFVVIDHDLRLVRRLRERGIEAVGGDAERPSVLESARPGRARLLVAAIPDGTATRQIADYRRSRYPDLPLLVRMHSREEQAVVCALDADMAFVGEEELAIQMARYALQRFGLSLEEADTLACSWRPRDKGALPALE